MLWAAIRATQEKWDDVLCVVYTGDQGADKETILSGVKVVWLHLAHTPLRLLIVL